MARTSRKNKATQLSVTTKKTALYIRLSREDEGKKSESLDNQRTIMEQHLLGIPELGTPTIYQDNGYTGRNSNRPQLQQLLADVEAGLIECILVKDASRLGRNSIETTYYIESLFPKHSVRVISVTDGYDSSFDKDGSEGTIILLRNMINEAHSIDLGKKITASTRQTILSGGFVGYKAPFGFRKSPDDKHKLIIDPYSADIVRDIYGKFLELKTVNAVKAYLNDNGIITPLQYFHQETGKEQREQYHWVSNTITVILSSVEYIGHCQQGKRQNKNRIPVRVSSDQYILVKNTHEPIISEEDFNKVGELLQESKLYKEPESLANRKRHKKNIFVKKIFCGECGKPIQRLPRCQKNIPYYKFACKSNERVKKGFCPITKQDFIEEHELMEIISTILGKYAESIFSKKQFTEKKESKFQLKIAELDKRLHKTEESVMKNQVFLKGLYENFINGNLTMDDYKDMKLSYEGKILAEKERFLVISKEKDGLKQEIALLNELTEDLSSQKIEVTQELVDKLIDTILVYENRKIEINFAVRFPLIDEVMHHGE